MKHRRVSLQNPKRQVSRRLLASVLLAGFVLAPSSFDSRVYAAEVLDEISHSEFADQNVKAALEVLRKQIHQSRRELPPGLTNEFEQSVTTRLKSMQESVAQYIIPDYKSATMATRILELTEHVLTLPYRKIPQDPEQRRRAQQEYAAVLNRFEKEIPDKAMHLDESSKQIIGEALGAILTEVQIDIFRPGYGRPLSDKEKVELNRIVDRLLQGASDLPSAQEKLRNRVAAAGKLANEGRRAVLEFLRGREPALYEQPSFVAAVTGWREANSTLAEAVNRQMKTADRAEIEALFERTRQQQLLDMLENNPQKIEQEQIEPKLDPNSIR